MWLKIIKTILSCRKKHTHFWRKSHPPQFPTSWGQKPTLWGEKQNWNKNSPAGFPPTKPHLQAIVILFVDTLTLFWPIENPPKKNISGSMGQLYVLDQLVRLGNIGDGPSIWPLEFTPGSPKFPSEGGWGSRVCSKGMLEFSSFFSPFKRLLFLNFKYYGGRCINPYYRVHWSLPSLKLNSNLKRERQIMAI